MIFPINPNIMGLRGHTYVSVAALAMVTPALQRSAMAWRSLPSGARCMAMRARRAAAQAEAEVDSPALRP
jgi:hypothetical protein